MSNSLGIIFALVALTCWGFGDFLLQRAVRKLGNWESLFIGSSVGSVILFPFVLKDFNYFTHLSVEEVTILALVALTFFSSSFISAESYKVGKLAVVESVGAIEILVAGVLSYFIFGEKLSLVSAIFVLLLISGILLVALKPHHFRREAWIERGAFLALASAVMLGLADFMISFGARATSPVITVWSFNIIIALIAFLYLKMNGQLRNFLKDISLHKGLMTGVGLLGNIAWLSFAFSIQVIPVVIALALSEGYIVLATSLGLFVNREKLQSYQLLGVLLAVLGAIALSVSIS